MAKRRILRLIREEMQIGSPWDIQRGFGRDELTGTTEDGLLVTINKKRAFLLSCNHIVEDRKELGGVCQYCFVNAVMMNHPYPRWISLACKQCFKTCSAPFCSRGLCPKHSSVPPIPIIPREALQFLADGKKGEPRVLCIHHYEQIVTALGYAQEMGVGMGLETPGRVDGLRGLLGEGS